MEILNWLLATFSALCGGGTIITLFMYRKQQKRAKNAEAFEKEVNALKGVIESFRVQMEFYESRLNFVQELIVSKDTYITQLTNEKHTLEVKHARNKSAINKAYECKACLDCPVLKQRAQNEEEYLRKIEKQ